MVIHFVRAGVIVCVACSFSALSSAASITDLVGKWRWENSTYECKEGGANGLSCVPLDGPNKGAELIASKVEIKDGALIMDSKDPATGMIYKTKSTVAGDTWTSEDCNPAGACEKAVMTRVK